MSALVKFLSALVKFLNEYKSVIGYSYVRCNCIYKKPTTEYTEDEFTRGAICTLYNKELVWYDYWIAYCD